MRKLNVLFIGYLLIYLVVMVSLLSACRTARPEKTQSYDSTSVRYIPRDTIIRIPGDSVRILVPIPCPDSVKWQGESKGNRISVRAKISKGTLDINCQADSLQQRIRLLEKELKEKSVVTQVFTKQVKVRPWYVKPLIITSLLLLLIVLIQNKSVVVNLTAKIIKLFT